MSSRNDYLSYLEYHGLSEKDVLPIMKMDDMPPDAIAALLIGLATTGKDNEKNKENPFETIAKIVLDQKNTNILLDKIHEALNKNLIGMGYKIPGNVYAGVFPTNCFNAQCVGRPSGYLILVDTGCFEILAATNSVLMSKWDKQTKAEVQSKIIKKYCDDGEIFDLNALDPPGLKGDGSYAQLQIINYLTTAAERFVIAHEYGHILNQHIHVGGQVSNILSHGRQIKVASKTKDNEYEADIWAMNALIKNDAKHNIDKEKLALSYGGIIAFMSIALLIEEYQIIKGFHVDTHPRAAERIYMFESFLELLGYQEEGYLGKLALELSGDAAEPLLGKDITVSILDRELNQKLDDVLDGLNIQISKPRWFSIFR